MKRKKHRHIPTQMVEIEALMYLPYISIRKPGERFMAAKGYADMFIMQGMAKPVDGSKYERRDMRAIN